MNILFIILLWFLLGFLSIVNMIQGCRKEWWDNFEEEWWTCNDEGRIKIVNDAMSLNQLVPILLGGLISLGISIYYFDFRLFYTYKLKENADW